MGELLQAASPPSDTNPKYTRPSGDVYPPIRVVREVDAEFVVDGSLVRGVSVCWHRVDVFELAHQCVDLGFGELGRAVGWLGSVLGNRASVALACGFT